MSTIDTGSYDTCDFGTIHSLISEQYPHQASSSRKDLRLSDNGIDAHDASHGDTQYRPSRVENGYYASRAESGTPSQEPLNRSIADDFEYQNSRASLPSVIASPDSEHAPVSPVVSEMEDRFSSPVISRRSTQEHIPARSR